MAIKKNNKKINRNLVAVFIGFIFILIAAYYLILKPNFNKNAEWITSTPTISSSTISQSPTLIPKEVIKNVYDSYYKIFVNCSVDYKTDNFARGRIYATGAPTSTPGLIKKTENGWEYIMPLQQWESCQKIRDFGVTDADMAVLHIKIQGTTNGVAYCF